MWLVLALGVGVGLLMGLTGAGGGILSVPILVTGLGWSMQEAAPVALMAVAVGASVGAVDGLRKGLVRYKAALLMALFGVPMTRLGLDLAKRLPGEGLKLVFAILLIHLGLKMYRQARSGTLFEEWGPLQVALINHQTGRFIWTPSTALLMIGIGSVTGLLSGLLGVGGGFFIVPMLKKFSRLSMPGIVATSLFLIALVSGGGVINASLDGTNWPAQTWPFVVAVTLGVMGGRRFAHQVRPELLQRAFAGVLLMVAVILLAQAGSEWWIKGMSPAT